MKMIIIISAALVISWIVSMVLFVLCISNEKLMSWLMGKYWKITEILLEK